jgi:hypothetical protein
MNTSIDFDSLIKFTDAKLFKHTNRHLQDVEVIVLKGVLEGKTFEEMAQVSHYSVNYLRGDIGNKLFQILSITFGTREFSLKSRVLEKVILEQYFSSLATKISEDESI